MQEYGKSVTSNESAVGVQGIDLAELMADFRMNLRLIAIVFVLIFSAIIAFVLLQTPKFSAASTVMIGSRSAKAIPTEQNLVSELPTDTAQIDTEVEVLKSVNVAKLVADQLNLYADPEFNPNLKSGDRFSVSGLLGRPARNESPTSEDAKEQVLNNVLSAVSIKRTGQTRVIGIYAETETPRKSVLIADAWAEAYLKYQLSAKSSQNSGVDGALAARLEELRQDVATADTAVQQYIIANNLMSAGGSSLTEQEISNLNQQLAVVRVEAAESEARLSTARRQLAAGSAGGDVGEALASEVIRDLRKQAADNSRLVAQLQSNYGPRHPEVIKALNEKAAIEAQIRAEIARVVSNLEAQAEVQRQRRASLAGSVASAGGRLAANNRAGVELKQLQLNAETARSVYESYLERYKQLSSQKGIEQTDAVVLANAKLPTAPSSPKMALAVLLAFALSSGGATVAFLGKRALRRGISTGRDVSDKLNLNYLGSVSELSTTLPAGQKAGQAPWKFLEDRPLSMFAESLRSIRTAISFNQLAQNAKVIAITSSLPGEGKTTTTLCLAKTIAMSGQSVVVLDCDTRRRSLSGLLTQPYKAGLLEVLTGQASLNDVVVSNEDGVHFIPLSPLKVQAEELFGSQTMSNLLDSLKARFDVVILDTAPILPIVDTRILAHKVDALVLLVRWNSTPTSAVNTAISMLKNEGVDNIVGAALTLVDFRKQKINATSGSDYYYNAYKSYYVD